MDQDGRQHGYDLEHPDVADNAGASAT